MLIRGRALERTLERACNGTVPLQQGRLGETLDDSGILSKPLEARARTTATPIS